MSNTAKESNVSKTTSLEGLRVSYCKDYWTTSYLCFITHYTNPTKITRRCLIRVMGPTKLTWKGWLVRMFSTDTLVS